MTWLLVLMLLHADGTVSQPAPVPFDSIQDCLDDKKAWTGQINRRQDQTDVIVIRCKVERPAGIEPTSPAWKAGASPFGRE